MEPKNNDLGLEMVLEELRLQAKMVDAMVERQVLIARNLAKLVEVIENYVLTV